MITVSIVLYKTPQKDIEEVLSSVVPSELVSRVFVIDNSPDESCRWVENASDKIIYIPHENTGYGSSHNVALQKAIDMGSVYHLIVNPDISFDAKILSIISNFFDSNPDVVYVLPKVYYPTGEIQYLCKLLPTPFDLIIRRFFFNKFTKKMDDLYTLKHSGYNKIMNPPCLSGCFMFLRVDTLKEYNIFFDDRYFMYCEDFDLIRRLHRVGKTLYYPEVSIIHNHAQESYKNIRQLLMHIKSAILYFNKWGWFFDKERKEMNKKILDELEKK